MSTAEIEATWMRIEGWLAANAPGVLASLSGGATEAQIAEAEAALDITLPRNLRDSYRRHNGQGIAANLAPGFIGGVELLDLSGVLFEWKVWKDLLDEGTFDDSASEPTGPIRPDWWNARWIPLTRDGFGNSYCLDLDPASGGAVGQIITMWHDDPERKVIAPSYGAWLAAFADELDAGEWTTHRLYDGLISMEDAEAEDE